MADSDLLLLKWQARTTLRCYFHSSTESSDRPNNFILKTLGQGGRFFVLFAFIFVRIAIMKFFQLLGSVAATVLILATSCSAQLSGSVGPTTSTASKAAKKICNVLNYGAKADKSTDLGPAITSAFAACNTGGISTPPPILPFPPPTNNHSLDTCRRLRHGNLGDAERRLQLRHPA